MEKHVVITGAGTGIGKATAQRFAQSGYTPVLMGRREEPLKSLQSEVGGVVLPCDITKLESISAAFETLKGLNVVGLINNAGIIHRATAEEVTENILLSEFETNLFGPIRLTQKLIPQLKAKKGFVVNVSSSIGTKPMPGASIYCATKAAMNQWSHTLALELAPHVRVNCVSPGMVETPIHGDLPMEQAKDWQPMGRVGQPIEIAEAIHFIAQSPWTTGENLHVDGGGRH